jgi:hypothetical protein
MTRKLLLNLLLLCFALLLSFQSVYTQEIQDSTPKVIFKESYKNKLGLYLYGISKYSNFEIKEAGQKNDSVLKYKPNNNFNIGAGFSYKWMGIGIAFNLGFINNDNDLKGETSSLDIQLDLYSEKFFFNGNFQYYQGYYWQNPEAFYPEWSINDSLVVRPDIETSTLGLNTVYVFNHEKFSFKAAYQYTERQVKSAGSMLLGARFSIYGVSADFSIVPTELHAFYPNSDQIGGLSSLSIGASFGYTHTFVIGKYFFINGLLMTGLNLQGLTAYDIVGEELNSAGRISNNVTFRLAFGINKPRNYYGLNFISDSFLLRSPNDTELSYSYGKFRIYYGMRFNVGKG